MFLDHLGKPWEYEPQGFETPSGPYLPDFHLPEEKVWLEIKGGSISEYDLARCAHVAKDVRARGERFFILLGEVPRMPFYDKVKGPLGIRCLAWDDACNDFTGFDGDGVQNYWLPALRELAEALTAARSARFEHGESGSR